MSEPTTKDWHLNQVRKFNEKQGTLKEVARVLESVLTKIKLRTDRTAIVQVRPKSLASFSEKAIRKKNKYSDPVNQLTDLVAGRIITYTRAGAERVRRQIEDLEIRDTKSREDGGLLIDWDNTIDTGERLKPEEFGYKAMHYIVQLVPPRVLDVRLDGWIEPYTMEVQVCTMMQHVWAAIGHDRVYKTRLKIPDALKRRLSAISALIETAQTEFDTGILALDRYLDFVACENQQEEDGMIWQSVVEVDHYDNTAHLRMGEHLAQSARWREAHDHFLQCDDSMPGILARRGRAAARNGDREKAKELFEQAIKQDTNDWSARCDLAELFEGRGDHNTALEQYRDAFAAAPHEPRVLTAYVAAVICQEGDLTCTQALRGALDATINECRHRAELGVDLPNAYFQIGRCYLFKGKDNVNKPDNLYKALEAYCKAGLVCRSLDVLEQERETVAKIFKQLKENAFGREVLEPYECAERLLCLLSVAVSQRSRQQGEDTESKADEKRAPLYGDPLDTAEENRRLTELATACEDAPSFKEPVVIVAGGCDRRYEEKLDPYRNTIGSAFKHFEGTVICGGTKAGISGVIGDVSSERGEAVKAIGYLPVELPDGDERDDKNYRIYAVRQVDAPAYSPVGPIQTWADLLLAGVQPSKVRLLGINGGYLSGFEFRLAIAMGATVGLIEDSGRAVSGLLTDPDWQRLGHFAKLISEAETIAPFVSAFCPMLEEIPEAEREKKLEELACAQHDEYRVGKQASEGYVHPSMFPWDKNLAEDYKRSNRQQVAYADRILRSEGFAIVPASDPRPAVDFNDEKWLNDEDCVKKLWQMARREHGRWNAERLAEGWQYGSERSLDKKTSPYLLPWEKLPHRIQEYDREPFQKLPALLEEVGLKIVQLRPDEASGDR